jgi:hypothetical protein
MTSVEFWLDLLLLWGLSYTLHILMHIRTQYRLPDHMRKIMKQTVHTLLSEYNDRLVWGCLCVRSEIRLFIGVERTRILGDFATTFIMNGLLAWLLVSLLLYFIRLIPNGFGWISSTQTEVSSSTMFGHVNMCHDFILGHRSPTLVLHPFQFISNFKNLGESKHLKFDQNYWENYKDLWHQIGILWKYT